MKNFILFVGLLLAACISVATVIVGFIPGVFIGMIAATLILFVPVLLLEEIDLRRKRRR